MSDPGRFVGKVAIITGAAHGIGEATALRLASEGAAVVIADIDDVASVGVQERIVEAGGSAVSFHCDVARAADWTSLAEHVQAEFGRLDIVFCNAHAVVVKPAHELTEDQWRRQLDVCLTQVFHAVKTFHGHLRQTHGTLVISSSLHAGLGLPGHPAYAAAKGGLSALTRQLAVDYGPAIRVNAVLIGPIETRAWTGVSAKDLAVVASKSPLGRLGTADEVAAAVCFLSSEEASYVTGANLVVDGGWSITK